MKFRIIRHHHQIEFPKWAQFVEDHPHGNIFQTPKIFDFYSNIKNYQPLIFYSVDDHNEPAGVLVAVLTREAGLTGFFSARCIIWGGPLVKNDDPVICGQLISSLNNAVKRKAIYTEVRNLFDTQHLKDCFAQNGFIFKDHLNYIVKLDDGDSVRKRMSNSKWRQIKKSIAEGAQIIVPDKLEQVESFYNILFDLYKSKVKKPLPPWSFFKEFFSSQDLGKYFLVEFEGKIIGGIMCPVFKDRIYEWYVAGLDREYKKVYPSVLATWAPIKYGLERGFKYFDFMGAGSPDADYGVREFKEKFGGQEFNFGRYLRINKPFFYRLGKTTLNIYQKLF